jgi:hypothetical protein
VTGKLSCLPQSIALRYLDIRPSISDRMALALGCLLVQATNPFSAFTPCNCLRGLPVLVGRGTFRAGLHAQGPTPLCNASARP